MKGDNLERAIAALRQGKSKQIAAQVGAISPSSVTRLLRTEVGLRGQWQTAQFQRAQRRARASWLDVVAENPWSGVKAIRLVQPAAYAWLYRNDRVWLEEEINRIDRLKSVGGSRVDWDSRDRELSSDVSRIGLALAIEAPETTIKLWQIYQRLPELKAKLAKLDRLPLTRSEIHRVISAPAIQGVRLREV